MEKQISVLTYSTSDGYANVSHVYADTYDEARLKHLKDIFGWMLLTSDYPEMDTESKAVFDDMELALMNDEFTMYEICEQQGFYVGKPYFLDLTCIS